MARSLYNVHLCTCIGIAHTSMSEQHIINVKMCHAQRAVGITVYYAKLLTGLQLHMCRRAVHVITYDLC